MYPDPDEKDLGIQKCIKVVVRTCKYVQNLSYLPNAILEYAVKKKEQLLHTLLVRHCYCDDCNDLT
jgi:hypothetical protein